MNQDNTSVSAETYLLWGKQKSEAGDYKGAIADYTQVIRLAPEDAIAYYYRGNAKDKLGMMEAAKADLQTALILAERTHDVSLIVTIEQTLRLNRITLNPNQCGGRPCIRGMRIRVTDVLGLLASGLSFKDILEEMPDLESEDILACLQFAAQKLDRPLVSERNVPKFR